MEKGVPMGRRVAMNGLENRVAELRRARGWSQGELARRAGLSRQALSAIEAGRYLPNVTVALRLARALGCRVEDLFSWPPAILEAAWPSGAGEAPRASARVGLAQVGGRVLAWPLSGGLAFQIPADGFLQGGKRPGPVQVALTIRPEILEETVVLGGCNPAFPLLGAHFARARPASRLLWIPMNSRAALRALARGELHIAGTHLWDPRRGQDNLEAVRRELAGRPVAVITFARWEEGLILAPGNPRRIRRLSDLARRGLRLVNREPGAGSRWILARRLREEGIRPSKLEGYRRIVRDHLGVAAAVAHGLADTGPGALPAARAFGLTFLPLAEVRYDLVIPLDFLGSPTVRTLLEVMADGAFRRDLEAIGGYDTGPTGTLVARLPGP